MDIYLYGRLLIRSHVMSVIKKEAPARVNAYIIGYISSVVTTFAAYLLVSYQVWPTNILIIVIAALAVLQLIIQLVFFLHLGNEKAPRWKLATISMAVIIVGIVVGGSIWIMNNMNTNMTNMTPEQEAQYLKNNEGL